jgi:hypothetical protein
MTLKKKKKKTQLPETCMQCIIEFGLFSPIDEIPCKKKRKRNPLTHQEEEEEEERRSKLNSTHQCFI